MGLRYDLTAMSWKMENRWIIRHSITDLCCRYWSGSSYPAAVTTTSFPSSRPSCSSCPRTLVGSWSLLAACSCGWSSCWSWRRSRSWTWCWAAWQRLSPAGTSRLKTGGSGSSSGCPPCCCEGTSWNFQRTCKAMLKLKIHRQLWNSERLGALLTFSGTLGKFV